MVRTQISLEPEMYQLAQAEAGRLGISFAELCRRALAGVLRRPQTEKPWMRFSGTVEIDDPNASRSVDEVVYGREWP